MTTDAVDELAKASQVSHEEAKRIVEWTKRECGLSEQDVANIAVLLRESVKAREVEDGERFA